VAVTLWTTAFVEVRVSVIPVAVVGVSVISVAEVRVSVISVAVTLWTTAFVEVRVSVISVAVVGESVISVAEVRVGVISVAVTLWTTAFVEVRVSVISVAEVRVRAWECFWGALGGLWLQNSLSAQNRIIQSNLKNTVKYVVNMTYNTPAPYDPSLQIWHWAVPEEHKRYFEEGNRCAVRCLPCTWQAQQQGSSEEVVIMLDKKENDSLLGVRKSKKQKKHEVELAS